MKRIILYSIAIALGVALYATSSLDYLESNGQQVVGFGSTNGTTQDQTQSGERTPSSEATPQPSSLSYYIKEEYDKAIEALQNELDKNTLNHFQLEKSLDRLPTLFAKINSKDMKPTLLKFVQLLKVFEQRGTPEFRARAKAEIETVEFLMELPSFTALLEKSESLKLRSKDDAPFTTDQQRVSFLSWSDAYAQRRWVSESSKRESLVWLYFSGFAGYQNFGQGAPQLREYILRCDGRKENECQYLREARSMVKTLEQLDGPKTLSKDQ